MLGTIAEFFRDLRSRLLDDAEVRAERLRLKAIEEDARRLARLMEIAQRVRHERIKREQAAH